MNEHSKLHAIDGGTITPDEAELLAAFRAMHSDGRYNALRVMHVFASNYPRTRLALTLVSNGKNGAQR